MVTSKKQPATPKKQPTPPKKTARTTPAKKTKAPARKRKSSDSALENRRDLFDLWVIRHWLEGHTANGEAFRIWLTLFMGLYDELQEDVQDSRRRDELFLRFTNEVFPPILDTFKWHESALAGADIGLVKALKEISQRGFYVELLDSYSTSYTS